MMRQVLFDHLFCQLARGYAKIAPGPKVSSPIPLLYMGKFFKYFARCASFYSPHYIRRRYIGWGRNQYVDMVLAHHPTQYLNFKSLTRLAHKLPQSLCKLSTQNLVTVLGHPHEMIFNFVLGMTPLSILHAKHYNPYC